MGVDEGIAVSGSQMGGMHGLEEQESLRDTTEIYPENLRRVWLESEFL
jgi:hypothetical protein